MLNPAVRLSQVGGVSSSPVPCFVVDGEGVSRQVVRRAVGYVETALLVRVDRVVELLREGRVEGLAFALGLGVRQRRFDAQPFENVPAHAERVDETARRVADVAAQRLFVERIGRIEREDAVERAVVVVGAIVGIERHVVREASVGHVVRIALRERSDVLEEELVHVAVGEVDAQRCRLLVRLVHHARRGVVAARHVVTEILAAAREHQIMDVVESRAQRHSLPVGVDAGVDPVEFFVVGFLVGDVGIAAAREIAVDAGLTFVFELFACVEQPVVRQIGDADLEIARIVDLEPAGLRRAGGDDHHAVGRLRTVERGGRSVFEHRDRLYVVRGHVEDVGDVHLRAVEDEERDVGLVAFDETASSAEHHVGNLVGIRTVGDIVEDLEAGRLELNDVQHVGVYHVLDLLPLDDMRGARVTLPFLVDESRHHDLSDVGRRLSQADVVVGASRNEFDRLVAISQHRDAQRRGFRRAVECETSVRPDRSAVGTAACVVSHDVGSDDGLSRGVVRHAARYAERSCGLLPECGDRCEERQKRCEAG